MLIKNKKIWIYPFIVILIALSLSFLKVSGSSVGVYQSLLGGNIEKDENLLFSKPRAIRSDQFLVVLPYVVSQDINNEPNINKDIGDGINVSTQNLPSKNLFSIFRPTLFSFYLSNDTEFSYSFFWWMEFALLLISTYLLLIELTKKNFIISILGSLIFLFTPFFTWWNQYSTITWISFGLFFFLRLINEKNYKKAIGYGLGLSYSMVAYSLLLYPAFQIPVAYVAISVALGELILKRKSIMKNIKVLFPVIIGSIFIAGIFLILYFKQNEEIIDITMNTVYPGARFIKAGVGNLNLLFDGFYNILLQSDSNVAPFGNQCESSNFFLLFPPIVLWVIYKNISLIKKKIKLDWTGIFLSMVLILFSLWYLYPLPDYISKFTLLYLVPPQRLLIGIGFASYLLALYVLSNKIYSLKNRFLDFFIGILLAISYGYLTYRIGYNIYNISPSFFNNPTVLNPQIKIILASLFSFVLVILILKSYKKIFLILFSSFAFLSILFVNPLYKGLDILINTELSDYIEEKSIEDDSKWIIYGTHLYAQYALANNANVVNGVHYYPQFKMWKILDPDGKYTNIYNRYAHIVVSEYTQGQETIQLLQEDVVLLNISPCDQKLKTLGVKYVMTSVPLNNTSCLTKDKDIDNITIYTLDK